MTRWSVYMPHHLIDEAMRLGWTPARGPLAHHDAYSTTMTWRCAERDCREPPLPAGFRRAGAPGRVDPWTLQPGFDP